MAAFGFTIAGDAAFGIVFGVFVLALAVLAVVAIRWGIRRDRPGREAWRQRHLDAIEAERRHRLGHEADDQGSTG